MSDIVRRLRLQLPRRAHLSCRTIEAEAADEIEQLREAHERIVEWSRAYPLAVFPKPDLRRAHELLQAGGMTLDAISAEAMRHVIEQVAKISSAALERKP